MSAACACITSGWVRRRARRDALTFMAGERSAADEAYAR